MKKTSLFTASLLGLLIPLNAAEISHDAEASYSASTGARTNLGGGRNGDVSEQNTHLQYVLSYTVPEKPILRLGFAYDRYDFGFAGPALIPGALQSLNLVVGLDLKISDVLLRIEAQPGLYGDNRGFDSDNFNTPVILGASYLVSKDFQWIAGLRFDANWSSPVLGGLGFRWQIADRWVLNIVPPNPRVEYKATDDVTLYAGGQFLGGSFRVNNNFGGSRPGRNYNNALVAYSEVRVGAGALWKFGPRGTLDFQLGYLAYRDFDFHKVEDNFENKQGSFYGQAGVRLSF